jgi:D-glycero-alpha-D-manno-heptose-7-phosphate kinase
VGVALMVSFRAAAPVRLDFAGGWTDVPPFSSREGGMVVTAAIQLFARAEVRLGGSGFRLISEDLRDELQVSDSGLRMLPVGGCTLTTRSDAPPGSGLGSSGALDVALVAALSLARGESRDPVEIAETACHLEAVEAGIPGGRQDQFASSHGGFLRLEFKDPDAEVNRLKLDAEFMADLARRMVLCYTSASRFSGTTIARVMKAYEEGENSSPRTGDISRHSMPACARPKWPAWSMPSAMPARWVERRPVRARVAACSSWAPMIPPRSLPPPAGPEPRCFRYDGPCTACARAEWRRARSTAGADSVVGRSLRAAGPLKRPSGTGPPADAGCSQDQSAPVGQRWRLRR